MDAALGPHQGLTRIKNNVPQIVFLLATFGFVTTLSWLGFSIVSQSRNKRRLSRLARPESRKDPGIDWRQRVLTAVRPLAKLATPKHEEWDDSPLRLRFLHAGYRNQSAATVFLAIKTATVITFPTLFFVFGPTSLRLIFTALWAIVLAAMAATFPMWCCVGRSQIASARSWTTSRTRSICSRSAWKRGLVSMQPSRA